MALAHARTGRDGLLRERVEPHGEQHFCRSCENFFAYGGVRFERCKTRNTEFYCHFGHHTKQSSDFGFITNLAVQLFRRIAILLGNNCNKLNCRQLIIIRCSRYALVVSTKSCTCYKLAMMRSTPRRRTRQLARSCLCEVASLASAGSASIVRRDPIPPYSCPAGRDFSCVLDHPVNHANAGTARRRSIHRNCA